MENLLIPYEAALSIPCARALVFAPHPDDEVFGCGGTIMRHVQHNTPVHVIIVSDGTYGVSAEAENDHAIQRQNESIAAAQKLGYGIPAFWHYPDRQISYSEKLIQHILASIREIDADLVYAPSVLEMHPDHRALGMAVSEAVRRIGKLIRVAFYEVGVPLHPNLLLDISDLVTRKSAAMACFSSQNAKQRYDQHIAALNRYRTYTLPEQVSAAEAYMLVNAEALADDPLKLYESEHTRQKVLGLPLDSSDLPLVSVIIRSMDRPSLIEALDSVALQTYPHIEVVIVNAKGADHGKTAEWCGNFPIRKIDMTEPSHRSHAANAGLLAAQGHYLVFLDDDDLFLPDHVATLVQALQDHPGKRCAYTGARVDYFVDGQFQKTTQFNDPFDAGRLWGRNFIPIHAMLFERSLVTEDQCRFDEHLEIFEDWDFWIQLSQHTDILHIDKITTVYRNHGYSGMGFQYDADFVRKARVKVYDKWKTLLTGEQLEELIQYREDLTSRLHKLLAENADQFHNLNLENQQREQSLQQKINNLNSTVDHLNRVNADSKRIINDLNMTIHSVFHSTSWKVTSPLRFLVRIARGQYHEAWDGLRRKILFVLKTIYWRLPHRWRDRMVNAAYRIAGPLFSGLGHYESWRTRKSNSALVFRRQTGNQSVIMMDSAETPLLMKPPLGRIAIHAHIFYADLVPEFSEHLKAMPFPYDLFISAPDESVGQACKQASAKLPSLQQLTVAIVPNRGRDIAPFFCTFGETLQQYDYVAHIHSKKSLHNNGGTDGWREYLLTGLLGNTANIRKIFALLTENEKTGLIYPQNFAKLPYSSYTWLSNRQLGQIWCNKLGIPLPKGYFDFPAGSMFWARTKALQPLFDAHIKLEDFPVEAGQKDATLAHCIERLFVPVCTLAGYNTTILQDAATASWSRWRFEQYLSHDRNNIRAILADPAFHVVVFDIFDTLLTRPLLDPEMIKHLVAHRVDEKTGQTYLQYRALAETQARQKAGRDVDLNFIYAEFLTLSGLDRTVVEQLQQLEQTIEQDIVVPRPEAIALMQFVIASGKRVILASDMYLPRLIVESMLQQHGILGWHALYLSSDIGIRKDTGDLYRQLLSQENTSPSAVIVIGDNEHSDAQIPNILGIRGYHILRPVELARATPRLESIIENSFYRPVLNEQLTLGSIVQAGFSPLYYPGFSPANLFPPTPWIIGYAIVGPLILSFVQWLTSKAQTDNLSCLYFLAREGQILKTVYDRWVAGQADAVPSDYLILSRRTITVPMITNLEDIYSIASTQYYANSLRHFIQERYGVTLSDTECEKLDRQGVWKKNKQVNVDNGNMEHLKPVLQTLQQRILDAAQTERPGLLAYLNKIGLSDSSSNAAIVDIGYSATIQSYLNRLLNKKIHGFYLVTTNRAEKVSSEFGVTATGYYAHGIEPLTTRIPIYVQSFSLEKLMSSDDAQIVRYRLEASGDSVPEFRQLADEERQSASTRAEIRRGILDFVTQSVMIRERWVSDFEVPMDVAVALFDEFIQHASPAEQRILGTIVLDDHYCGRGLVS